MLPITIIEKGYMRIPSMRKMILNHHNFSLYMNITSKNINLNMRIIQVIHLVHNTEHTHYLNHVETIYSTLLIFNITRSNSIK